MQEFSFKGVKVMLPYKVGGGLPVVGVGGSVMTHTAGIQICDGFLTIQEHLIFKTGDGLFAIH